MKSIGIFTALLLTSIAGTALAATAVPPPTHTGPGFADTCGTPTSIAGCKPGDCYGGDMLGRDGVWVGNPVCAIRVSLLPQKKR